jgi:hypothetical protein
MTTPKTPKLRKRQVDLLLLSIIRAYPHPDNQSEHERIATAKEALLGIKRGHGRAVVFDDLAVFKIQAEVRKGEIDGLRLALAKFQPPSRQDGIAQEAARDPKKTREAARLFRALAGASEGITEEAKEDRLRKKAAKRLSAKDMGDIESLFDPKAPFTRNIVSILELLEGLGVQSEKIWDVNVVFAPRDYDQPN